MFSIPSAARLPPTGSATPAAETVRRVPKFSIELTAIRSKPVLLSDIPTPPTINLHATRAVSAAAAVPPQGSFWSTGTFICSLILLFAVGCICILIYRIYKSRKSRSQK